MKKTKENKLTILISMLLLSLVFFGFGRNGDHQIPLGIYIQRNRSGYRNRRHF